jgi:tripartite-type tricarboxylate transporter receptor subunit TctC
VQFACNNAPTVIGQVKAGALRALFVTPERLAELPDAPSAAETGFADMNKIVGWTALMGPPGLPREVVERWTDVFRRLAKDPDWQAGNAKIGGIAAIRSPAESDKFMREQYELYDKLVTHLGIRQ